ncbi:MAG: type II/IV secretion system protein, partial [Deltaproteobacteria bacterium]
MRSKLNLDKLIEILKSKKLISLNQERLIKKRSKDIWQRLIKAKKKEFISGTSIRELTPEISPIDIITEMKLTIPGSSEILTDEHIGKTLSEVSGFPFMRIDPLKLDAKSVTSLLPKPFALKHFIVALTLIDGKMRVAMADPFDTETIDDLKRFTRYIIDPVVSPKSDIMKIITEFYGFRTSVSAAAKELSQGIDLGNLEQYVKLKAIQEIEATDKHIVNAVEYLLHYAFDQRASDIHIEPKRDNSITRFRIDGMLHQIHTMPKIVHNAVVSRIKMLARMDIAEKRRPQDGRIKTNHNGREIELRVSSLPVAFGEKLVIRIFDPDILMQDLENLGFFPRELELFKTFIAQPHGIILVTGPTGSGKTTTLYSSLKVLSTVEVNIVTIEEPIEMICEEFNQVSVQPQIGLTFANILKTILRQDPDIIMVGEIRDLETAENAIQAALTGHLVFSTLHTNDAPTAITRLVDLGVPPFLISSTVIGVMAQRLVRKICPSCQKSIPLGAEEIEILGIKQFEKRPPLVKIGEGCPDCRWTGYKGRTGLFEVMEITPQIREMILSNVDVEKIRIQAKKDGMITLREYAIEK